MITISIILCVLDDTCLMAPTATAMQNLLDVCHNYGAASDILFNPLKSVCIVYKPKYYKLFCPSVNYRL